MKNKLSLSTVASFYVIIPILLTLCIVSLYLRAQQIVTSQGNTETVKYKNKQMKWLLIVLLLIYMLVYIWLTFLCRNPSSKPIIVLTPFHSYQRAFQLFPFRIRRLNTARQIFLNILLTVPLGLLLPLLFNNLKHPFMDTAVVTLALSILTESLQYITRLGYCEMDDIFNNLLGCLAGMAVLAIGTRQIRKKVMSNEV